MVNTERLKIKIREEEKTQADCARHLSLKTPSFNQKLNNIRPFNLSEAGKLQDFLGISNREFADYFFMPPVALRNKTAKKKQHRKAPQLAGRGD